MPPPKPSDRVPAHGTVEPLPDAGQPGAIAATRTGHAAFEAVAADDGVRLDRFLASRLADLSRSRIQALIKSGCVRGQADTVVDPDWRVKPGDRFELALPEPAAPQPIAEAMPLTVVFEDSHLIVIDKPAGLVVHPAAGHPTGTLVNALIAHCGDSLSGIGGVRRPGIVHRLDKDTSGLLVVAKSDVAHQGLAAQFASHGADGRLERSYLAFAWGAMPLPRGRIDAALMRSASNRTKITIAKTRAPLWPDDEPVEPKASRHAVTHYETVTTFTTDAGKNKAPQPIATLVRCRLETGRTHQIRVHLAHIGHPLLGDRTYGSHFAASARRLEDGARTALEQLGRQALHAAHLAFDHPVTRRHLAFDSPLPPDLQALHDALVASSVRRC